MKAITISIQQRFAGQNVFLLALISGGAFTLESKIIVEPWHVGIAGQSPQPTVTKVYKPMMVSTGLSLPALFWDKDKKQAKGTYTYINDKVDQFKKYVHDLHHSMVSTSPNNFALDKFKEQIKLHISGKIKTVNKEIKAGATVTSEKKANVTIPKYYGNEVNGIKTNFIDYITHKIDQYKSEGSYVSGVDDGTLKVYGKLRNLLIRYKEATGINYDVTTFSTENKKALQAWMISLTKENGEPYAESYIGWFGKEVHNFLSKAKYEDKLPVDVDACDLGNKKVWKRSRQKQNDPYLSLSQLNKLKALKFGKKSAKEIEAIKNGDLKYIEESTLEKVRDMFLVNCGCGYRFSDFQNIKHLYKINGKFYFQNTSEKTNTPTKIPVRDKWIISLYENKKEFDIDFSEQTYNRALKVLGFRAGFDDVVAFNKLNVTTNKREAYDKELWACITSKTARKTFCSLEVLEYLTPLSTLVSWGGWSSEATLRSYLQLTPDDYTLIGERTYEVMQRAMKVA